MTTSVNVLLFIFAASVLLTNDVIAGRLPTETIHKLMRKMADFDNCCREIKCHIYDCILIPGKSKTACKCMSDRSHDYK